jgi:hypothetical protein
VTRALANRGRRQADRREVSRAIVCHVRG